MKFFKLARKIRTEEDGAVTVDWVVLTAAVVGLGLIALAAIRPAISTLSGNIALEIGEADDDFGRNNAAP